MPTIEPTALPTMQPSAEPSGVPTGNPTSAPSAQPSLQPTGMPTLKPSLAPSAAPTAVPTSLPSLEPTKEPTPLPTTPRPTVKPGNPTATPTFSTPIVEGLSVRTASASQNEFNPSEKLTLYAEWSSSDPLTTLSWTSDGLSLVYGETTSTATSTSYLVILPESKLDGSSVFTGGTACT